MTISRSDVRAALARAYCTEHNRDKPIDALLLEDMVDELMKLFDRVIRRVLERDKQLSLPLEHPRL